jgi:spore coat protein X
MNQEVYRSSCSKKEHKWSALDETLKHPLCTDGISTEAVQKNEELQLSEELIFIKDSCDVTVNTTDTKAALSLQAALQAAILIVLKISLASSEQAEEISQELIQSSKIKQITRQKTIIENSRKVNVTTTDTQIAVNIQLLLAILISLLFQLDIL